ncbi:MAG: hypothetical protein KDK99_07960 [Verrucomicrobiales bacterium]|nr:hypothetical protein [Verrucomicrobiales bacterium]
MMRTTVTIDPDTEILLKETARKTGRSFKVILNEAVRTALGQSGQRQVKVMPLFSAPFPKNLADANFNRLADEWDDGETLHELVP